MVVKPTFYSITCPFSATHSPAAEGTPLFPPPGWVSSPAPTLHVWFVSLGKLLGGETWNPMLPHPEIWDHRGGSPPTGHTWTCDSSILVVRRSGSSPGTHWRGSGARGSLGLSCPPKGSPRVLLSWRAVTHLHRDAPPASASSSLEWPEHHLLLHWGGALPFSPFTGTVPFMGTWSHWRLEVTVRLDDDGLLSSDDRQGLLEERRLASGHLIFRKLLIFSHFKPTNKNYMLLNVRPESLEVTPRQILLFDRRGHQVPPTPPPPGCTVTCGRAGFKTESGLPGGEMWNPRRVCVWPKKLMCSKGLIAQ